MNFDLTPEQQMLQDSLSSYLRDHYGFAMRRQSVATRTGWSDECWRAFAQTLGILSAPFGAHDGGLGGGAVENMIVMEAFGRALVVEPYLATAVIGGGLLKYGGGPRVPGLIAGIIAGEVVLAFAHREPTAAFDHAAVTTRASSCGDGYVIDGEKSLVLAAPGASHLIVSARSRGASGDPNGLSLFIVDRAAPGISGRDYATFDGGRASELRFDQVLVPFGALIGREGEALPLVERVADEATAALCAEAVGVQRKLLDETLSYARQRKQFGRALGEFQVLQHRMADMALHLERSAAMTTMATLKLSLPAAERARAVSAAKVTVGQACRFIGQSAVQIHGGMGMSDEMPVSHFFKRATGIENELGTTADHLARYERLSALPSPNTNHPIPTEAR